MLSTGCTQVYVYWHERADIIHCFGVSVDVQNLVKMKVVPYLFFSSLWRLLIVVNVLNSLLRNI
jgi:hypothetical protein